MHSIFLFKNPVTHFYVLTHSECEEIRRGQGSPVQDSDTSVAFWTLVKTTDTGCERSH